MFAVGRPRAFCSICAVLCITSSKLQLVCHIHLKTEKKKYNSVGLVCITEVATGIGEKKIFHWNLRFDVQNSVWPYPIPTPLLLQWGTLQHNDRLYSI